MWSYTSAVLLLLVSGALPENANASEDTSASLPMNPKILSKDLKFLRNVQQKIIPNSEEESSVRAYEDDSKRLVRDSSSEAQMEGRIVNGTAADASEVPYQAALRMRVSGGWSHFCGGVIVHQAAVLTAAHCTDGTVAQNLMVVVGTAYRTTGGTSSAVRLIIQHPGYSSTSLLHDISILVLAVPLTFSSTIAPVDIAPPSTNLNEGTEAIVSGFGTTSADSSPSYRLQIAKVMIVGQAKCKSAYRDLAMIYRTMICAANSDPPRDACQGDSGGPLVTAPLTGNPLLVGLVSWGEDCAHPDYPGVYTRVSIYYSWVYSHLKNV